jgi:uncharacterized protein YgiM (DUF1202 family)
MAGMTTIPATIGFVSLVIATAPADASAQAAAEAGPRREPAAAQAPSPAAEGSRRVVVTAASAPAHSCSADTCRVVVELGKGTVVSVLKTEGGWHQVLVRVGQSAMTTAWVQEKQVSSTTEPTARLSASAPTGTLRPAAPADATAAPAGEADPRGCLTCLATREPTREEWSAALADTATRKARPEDRPIETGLADGRTSAERMRDAVEARYGEELVRLGRDAAAVDRELQAYLAACVERFATIPVEGAAPRSNAVDDMLRAARATPGAARFQVWAGTAGFQWQDSWEAQADPTSTLPSCSRLWQDARSHAERLKVDVELLERDARAQDIFPAVVRAALEAHGLAEPTEPPAAAAPATTVR